MTYREYYRNDDGEPMGYGTVYDDDIDPDVYYDRVMSDLYSDADNPEIPCEYCGNPDCQDDCEVIRCEADIATGTLFGGTGTAVCGWRIPIGGTCPNASSHTPTD